MIIGIAGTFASGKDTLGMFLHAKLGFMYVSTADIVREYAKASRGSIERPVLADVATELRRMYGGGVLAQRALDGYRHSIRHYPGVAITGIRSLGEAKEIKNAGGVIVFVDAPVELRYERTKTRARDGEASVSIEEFKQREAREANGGMTDADFSLDGIREMADFRFENSGDLETFLQEAKKALSL